MKKENPEDPFYKQRWFRVGGVLVTAGAAVYLFSRASNASPGSNEQAVTLVKTVISRPEKKHLNGKGKLVVACVLALTVRAIYLCPVKILMLKKLGFRVGYDIACRTIWRKYNLSPIVIIEENAGVPQFVTFVIYPTPWDEKNGISFLPMGGYFEPIFFPQG